MLLKRCDATADLLGGFNIEAAEEVCGGVAPLEQHEVPNLLSSLVEKSLVLMAEREEGTRYRMLETIRDYAREKLELSRDIAAIRVRHCDHFFIFAKASRDGMKGPDLAEWIRLTEADLDNIRAAIALALEGVVDPFIAVKFAVAMMAFWMLRGYMTEGRGVVRAALALPQVEASGVAHAHAAYVGAVLASAQSDHAEARMLLESCLTLRRRLGNPVEIAATLSTLSSTQLLAGDAEGAQASAQEALELFRSLGEKSGEAIALHHLGEAALYSGNHELAEKHLRDCLHLAQAVMHSEVAGAAELLLGELAYESGHGADARHHFERVLTVCREAGDRRDEAEALGWLGKLDLEAGTLDSARRQLGEAIEIFRELEMREELLTCLEDHVDLARCMTRPDLAVYLAAAAQACRDRLALVRSPIRQKRWEELLASLQATFPPLVYDMEWQAGGAANLDTAIQAATTIPMPALKRTG